MSLNVEIVRLAALSEHPRNYVRHPEDQLAHLRASLEAHGWYRNIVIARDGTILAGHGIRLAALALGLEEGPAHRLDLDPDDPRALKVLAGDNEVRHLVERDDRALTEILRDVREADEALGGGLRGTGFDEAMLATLVMVTRPESEIKDVNEAAHWAGLPSYEDGPEERLKVVVNFANREDRADFAARLDVTLKDAETSSIWWPPRADADIASLKFEG